MHWVDENGSGTKKAAAIAVTVPDKVSLFEALESDFGNQRGFGLATINLDHVAKLRASPDFHAAYARHTYVTADGNPIVWLSRLSGQTVDLLPGSELIDPIAELAARMKVPVALFGATDVSLAAAKAELESRYRDLQVVFSEAPPMGFDPSGETAAGYVDALGRSGARLCFLALGAPKQEMFAAYALDTLHQVGFVSIGAGLDFLSGQQVRAPKIVRRFAAEWLWRMLQNPRRLAGRYARCILILPRLTLTALSLRRRRSEQT